MPLIREKVDSKASVKKTCQWHVFSESADEAVTVNTPQQAWQSIADGATQPSPTKAKILSTTSAGFLFCIIHFSVFIFQYSVFIFQYSVFIFQYSVFIFQYSVFIFQYSFFSIQYSLFIA